MAAHRDGLSVQIEGYGAVDESCPLIQPPSAPVVTSSATANYARLSMLLIDAGTEAIANKVKENLPGSQTLEEALKAKKERMRGLSNRGNIKQIQYDVLYPSEDRPFKEEKIDLTLWVVLLHNITADAKKMKWSTNPKQGEKKGRSFNRFPTDQDRRAKWVAAIRRDDASKLGNPLTTTGYAVITL